MRLHLSVLSIWIISLHFISFALANEPDKKSLVQTAYTASGLQNLFDDYGYKSGTLPVNTQKATIASAKYAFENLHYSEKLINDLDKSMTAEELKAVTAHLQSPLYTGVMGKVKKNSKEIDESEDTNYLKDHYKKEKALPTFDTRKKILRSISKDIFIEKEFLYQDELYLSIRTDLIHCKDIFSEEYKNQIKKNHKPLDEYLEKSEEELFFRFKNSTMEELEAFYSLLNQPEVLKFYSVMKESAFRIKSTSEAAFIKRFRELRDAGNLCK